MATAYRPIAATARMVRRRVAQVAGDGTAAVAGELSDVSAYGCRVLVPADPALGGAIELTLDGGAPVSATVVWNRGGVLACRFVAPIDRNRLRALTIQDD